MPLRATISEEEQDMEMIFMGRFAPRQHQRTTEFRIRGRVGMQTARFNIRVFPLVLMILTLVCISFFATMMISPAFAQATQDSEQNQNNDNENLFGQSDNGDNLFGSQVVANFFKNLITRTTIPSNQNQTSSFFLPVTKTPVSYLSN